MRIACLHTAEVHVATFDRLLEGVDRQVDHIAREVVSTSEEQTFDAIVLAQASMQGAADRLHGVSTPVLTTPALAAQATIDIASNRN